MHVLVLGSGVIGTTIAYYAARDGYEVTVLDRQPAPGLETSFANAGEVSPGYSAPWAGPGVPLKAIKWLLMRHRPLVIKPTLDPAMWRWALAMLRNCTTARYHTNKARMLRLAEYSRDCLKDLRAQTNIAYDHRTLGTLQLFRSQKQLDGLGKDIALLAAFGVPYEVLDREAIVVHEPALARVKDKFVGALRLPGDETGDCLAFTQSVAKLAEQHGTRFRFGLNIVGIDKAGDRITGVRTDFGTVTADKYVVALGSHSPKLLAPIGIDLPVYPVKGFSITVPITDPSRAPESTVMDETHKVAVTRLGNRIRVGGTAQLSGYDLTLSPARRATLEHVVTDLFPGSGDVRKATFWTGLRPMTPDGTPIVGGTRYGNLYISTGHGTLGWTMAAGTGRVIADLVTGRKPEIETNDLGIDRYERPTFTREARLQWSS
jgi:D-amino-acid dehydrogenase